MVQATLRSRALVAIAVAIVLVPVSMVLIGGDKGSATRYYPLLISLALVPYALHQAFQGILKGFQRYDYSVLAFFVGVLVKVVMAIALVSLGFGILHLLGLEFLAWALAAGVGLLFLRRLIRGPLSERGSGLSREATRNLAQFAAIASALLLVDFIINDRSELLFIKLYRPDAEVGYYSLAFAMASYPMLLIPGALGSVLMPAISEQFGRRDTARVAAIYVTSARYLMMLAFPLAAGGIVMARPLAVAFFGQEYTPMVAPTQILFAVGAVGAVSQTTSSVIWGTNRPRFFLAMSLFKVPANIIGCVVLIPLYGMKGAALAQWVSAPAWVASLWYVSTRLKLVWPYKDTARIVLAAALMAVAVAFIQSYLSGASLIPVVVLLGGGLYFVLLLVSRAFRAEDWGLVSALSGRQPLAARLGRPLRLFQGVEPHADVAPPPVRSTVDSPEMPGGAG